MRVSIIMPAYNEEKRIGQALESILAQDIVRESPNQAEILVVDSSSRDRTVAVAARYGVALLEAHRGKLTARAVGIDNSRGGIIVAVDADTTYPPGWLRRILGHFQDRTVVAVSGARVYDTAVFLNAFIPMREMIRPAHYMCGSNSAFTRAAYYQVGGFAEIDQLDPDAMVREEESAFGDRLAGIGRYVYEPALVCYTSGRRFYERQHAQERRRRERF